MTHTISPKEEKITLGGGCFWCTETMFRQLRGIIHVESGYSGGTTPNPSYEAVCTGNTGHAEAVDITYRPDEISLEDILRIHLSTHNPTTLNRQGEDIGTQYRSIIFYRTEAEKETATQIIREIQDHYEDPIVTEVASFQKFYKAEDYHQDYYNQNTTKGYCQAVISPKLVKFRKQYQEKLSQ